MQVAASRPRQRMAAGTTRSAQCTPPAAPRAALPPPRHRGGTQCTVQPAHLPVRDVLLSRMNTCKGTLQLEVSRWSCLPYVMMLNQGFRQRLNQCARHLAVGHADYSPADLGSGPGSRAYSPSHPSGASTPGAQTLKPSRFSDRMLASRILPCTGSTHIFGEIERQLTIERLHRVPASHVRHQHTCRAQWPLR